MITLSPLNLVPVLAKCLVGLLAIHHKARLRGMLFYDIKSMIHLDINLAQSLVVKQPTNTDNNF